MPEQGVIRVEKDVIRADESKLEQARILMPLQPLSKFEIRNYYQNELKFNDVYSQNNLPKIKDKSIRTPWIALHVNGNNITYFDSFRVKHIPKEIKNYSAKKILKQIFIEHNQYNYSITCVYFCIGFIDFERKGKCLLDYINLFSPNEYEKNDKMIPKLIYFLQTTMKRMIK